MAAHGRRRLTAEAGHVLAAVEALQREAGRSARWFERVDDALDAGLVDVGSSMLRRRFSPADPGDHTPRWRYGVYRATQRPSLRGLRRQVTTARRSLLDVRRLCSCRPINGQPRHRPDMT